MGPNWVIKILGKNRRGLEIPKFPLRGTTLHFYIHNWDKDCKYIGDPLPLGGVEKLALDTSFTNVGNLSSRRNNLRWERPSVDKKNIWNCLPENICQTDVCVPLKADRRTTVFRREQHLSLTRLNEELIQSGGVPLT